MERAKPKAETVFEDDFEKVEGPKKKIKPQRPITATYEVQQPVDLAEKRAEKEQIIAKTEETAKATEPLDKPLTRPETKT